MSIWRCSVRLSPAATVWSFSSGLCVVARASSLKRLYHGHILYDVRLWMAAAAAAVLLHTIQQLLTSLMPSATDAAAMPYSSYTKRRLYVDSSPLSLLLPVFMADDVIWKKAKLYRVTFECLRLVGLARALRSYSCQLLGFQDS